MISHNNLYIVGSSKWDAEKPACPIWPGRGTRFGQGGGQGWGELDATGTCQGGNIAHSGNALTTLTTCRNDKAQGPTLKGSLAEADIGLPEKDD